MRGRVKASRVARCFGERVLRPRVTPSMIMTPFPKSGLCLLNLPQCLPSFWAPGSRPRWADAKHLTCDAAWALRPG